jgi:hypothetical protein
MQFAKNAELLYQSCHSIGFDDATSLFESISLQDTACLLHELFELAIQHMYGWNERMYSYLISGSSILSRGNLLAAGSSGLQRIRAED